MKRAWLLLGATGLLLTVVNACHTTYNNYIAPCCGPGCGPNGANDPVQGIYTIVPGKTPDPFYVAISNDGKCQDLTRSGAPGQWLGRALFNSPRIGTYCAYTWQSDTLAPPDKTFFDGVANLSNPEPDEPALGMQAPAPAAPAPTQAEIDAWFKPLHDLARDRWGVTRIDNFMAQMGGVRVAVVDSASGDLGGAFSDPTGHGRAVGRLIQDIGCSGQNNCRVQIVNYPALSLSTGNASTLQTSASGAGAYGTRMRLAEQIEKATNDWSSALARGTGLRHLIINLSLGWSGCWEDPNSKNLDSEAVRDAITRAACRGALVVAAGGNRDSVLGCPQNPGRIGEHVFPARWANGDRLTVKTCAEVGIDNANENTLGPLVLGISAVDELDEQLAIAEQDSTLVAYGNAVVVPDGASFTRQLSGTSMSAAAVSGIAAAVWASFPTRSAQQIEQDLIEPAVVLRMRPEPPPPTSLATAAVVRANADVPLQPFICNTQRTPLDPSECLSVRRASLCRSLEHAGLASIGCGPGPGEVSQVLFGDISDSTPPTDAIDCGTCNPSLASCEGCQPPGKDVIDPSEEPWAVVGPQPEGDSCGTCVLYKGSKSFQANFKSDKWQGMRNGVVQVSGSSFSVWTGALSGRKVTKTLTTMSTNPKTGLLKYARLSPAGNIIQYQEEISIP